MEEQASWRRTEYEALAAYYGTVVTYRFTTASFFLAAVAIVLGLADPGDQHYWLLTALTVGIWIVEIRNRGIFAKLLDRAYELEGDWADHRGGDLPLFTHLTARRAARLRSWAIPATSQRLDEVRASGLPPFRSNLVSHTLGLDLVYGSVLAFCLWNLWPFLDRTSSMDPFIAVVGIVLVLMGASLLRETSGAREMQEIIGRVSKLEAGSAQTKADPGTSSSETTKRTLPSYILITLGVLLAILGLALVTLAAWKWWWGG
jgi:hypothetical protein